MLRQKWCSSLQTRGHIHANAVVILSTGIRGPSTVGATFSMIEKIVTVIGAKG
jgi:hypothetical protein